MKESSSILSVLWWNGTYTLAQIKEILTEMSISLDWYWSETNTNVGIEISIDISNGPPTPTKNKCLQIV